MVTRLTINVWLAAVMVVLTLVCFSRFWIPRGIEVSLQCTAEKPVELQVFYAASPKDKWSHSEKKKVSRESELTFFLPVRELGRFRLDFGEKPGKVDVMNIRLHGKDTLELQSASQFTPYNIPEVKKLPMGVQIVSAHKDPFLVYNKSLSMRAGAKRQLQLIPFLLLVVSACGLSQLLLCLRSSQSSKKYPELGNVEALRIIFTLIIVVHHYVAFVFNQWSSGNIVEFFFILSGYLLALNYKPDRSLVTLARQRWVRFVPLVVVGSLLSCGGWDSFYGLFMIHSTGLAMRCVPADPAWYIAVLFWCTLFYVGCFKAFSVRKLYLLIGVITFVTSVMYVRFPGDWWAMCFDFIPKGMLRGLSCMGMGILLSLVIRRNPRETVRPAQKAVYSVLELGVLAYVVISLFYKPLHNHFWIMRDICIITMLSLFILSRGWVAKFMEAPVFARIAKYCLSIYLTHWAFMKHLFWVNDDITTSVCTGVFLAIGLGCVCHHLIEVPGARLLNKLIDWFKASS